MGDVTERLKSHGVNPEAAFTELYPALYAASTPADGGYRDMSNICAALAAAQLVGLDGKRVLDSGCGYGTTTMALAAYQPSEIIAVDSSAGMINYLNTILLKHNDLDVWLKSQCADVVLGDLYELVLGHFRTMREVFQSGMFWRLQGRLESFCHDSLKLDELDFGTFDAVVGNNFLHWPVNQRLAELQAAGRPHEELLREAMTAALKPLRNKLLSDGVAVLMEPADFISLDDNPERDADIERHAMGSHPLFVRFHQTVNRFLAEKHGITGRQVPVRTTLFKRSALSELVAAGGFQLAQIHHVEWAYTCDPLVVFLTRLPMTLASIKLPFEAKIALGQQVRSVLTGTLSFEERCPPRVHWFFLVLKPI